MGGGGCGDYDTHGSRCYKYYKEPQRSWQDAQDKCAGEGGALLEIGSQAEQEYIQGYTFISSIKKTTRKIIMKTPFDLYYTLVYRGPWCLLWLVGTPQKKRGLLRKFKYIIKKMDLFFTISLFGAKRLKKLMLY